MQEMTVTKVSVGIDSRTGGVVLYDMMRLMGSIVEGFMRSRLNEERENSAVGKTSQSSTVLTVQ